MSTDFSEGEPPKGGPTSPVSPTGFSETAPETKPAPRALDDEGEPEPNDPALTHDSDDRIVAIIAHWAGVLTYFIGPMIMYIVQKDKRSLAAWHSREALNLQLATTIYYLLPTPVFCLSFYGITQEDPLLIGLGLFLPLGMMVMVAVYELAVVIWASVAAYQGKYFRIPLNISFVPRPDLPSPMDDHADFE